MEARTTKLISEYMFVASATCCIVISLLPTSFIMACFEYLGARTQLISDLWPSMSGTTGLIGVALLGIATLAAKYRSGIYCLSLSLADNTDRLDDDFHTEASGFSGLKQSFFYIWVGLCFVTVLITYWPSIQNGYFRYDDFEFISFYRNLPLLKSLIAVHGDHALPLYRLEVAIMYSLFGVNHVPYNLALLAVFCLTAIFSGLILRELRTGILGLLFFLALYIGWTQWSSSLTGYYCLSAYIQAALFCEMAIWSFLKWGKTGKCIFKILFTIAVALAVAVDLSGVYVPIAAGFILLADFLASDTRLSIREWFKKHAWFVWSLIIISIAYGLFLIYVFKFVNPGTFMSMNSVNVVKGAQLSSTKLMQLYLFVANGLVLSAFIPCYNILPTKVLIIINILIFSVAAIIVYYIGKLRIDKSFKAHSFGMLAIILVIGVIVITGRQSTGFNFEWFAKYSGPAYMWFCVLAAFCWNAVWKLTDRAYRPIALQFAMILLIAMFVLRVPYRYNDIGKPSYYFHISDAVKRKAAVGELRDKLIMPLFAGNISEVAIPTLDGTFIGSKYDQLFQYNLVHYLDFIVPEGKKLTLYRNLQMQGWGKQGVTTVADLRQNISSNFMDALNKKGYLQQIYTRSHQLSYKECNGNCVANAKDLRSNVFDAKSVKFQKDGSLMITSNGRTKIKLTHGKWNPETRHILLVDVTSLGQHPIQPILGVWFEGELSIPYSTYQLQLGAFSQRCKTIDLLQLPAYSLNSKVSDIELRFPESGDYIVRMAKFE